MKSFVPALLVALLAIPSLYAQTDEEYLRSTITELISTSGAGGVFSDFSTKVLDLCTQYTGGEFTPDSELQRLAAVHFAQDRLIDHLEQELFKRSERAKLEALLAWHKSDWYRETKSMLDAEREESYREFRQRTEGDTLAAGRAELIRRFVAANDVGPYFLGIMEAEHDAIRAFGAVLGHEILGDLPYFTEEQRETVRKSSENRTYQYFIYRFHPLSDEEFERYVEAYESESGRWYVRVYCEALNEAIRLGGRDLAAALEAEKE